MGTMPRRLMGPLVLIAVLALCGTVHGAVGDLDISLSLKVDGPTEMNITDAPDEIPFTLTVTPTGNFIGELYVTLTVTSSPGTARIQRNDMALLPGQPQSVKGILELGPGKNGKGGGNGQGNGDDHQDDIIHTVTVTAKVSEEGNYGPGVGGSETGSIKVTLLADTDTSIGGGSGSGQHNADGYVVTKADLSMLPQFLMIAPLIIGVGFLGGIIPLGREWDMKILNDFMALAAGFIIGATVLHTIPESLDIHAGMGILGTIIGLAFFFVTDLIEQRTCLFDPKTCDEPSYKVFAGFVLHHSVEGMVVAVGILLLLTDPFLGMIMLFAIGLDMFPEAFSLTSYYTGKGMARRRTFILLCIFEGVFAIGVVLGAILSGFLDRTWFGFMVGLSSGLLLSIGIVELVYKALWKEGIWNRRIQILIIIGFIIMGLIGFLE